MNPSAPGRSLLRSFALRRYDDTKAGGSSSTLQWHDDECYIRKRRAHLFESEEYGHNACLALECQVAKQAWLKVRTSKAIETLLRTSLRSS
ncbi:MAG: hypothetical protein HN666_06080 [Candidatus Peribacter sp.]|nr:hypothetical protein [Candidatus Peribacter sp.]